MEPLIKVENLYKLFVPLEAKKKMHSAMELINAGASRSEVQESTGITLGLADINFEVQRGEIFVLIGLSGSGKSTLVRCLNRLYEPTSGKILYEGEDIMQYNTAQLQEFRRTRMSMVFQSFALMANRNVLENVYYGLEIRGVSESKCREKGMEMLELVGLKGWEERKISDLSGGMKQRVGLARALANDTDVLLMDEAFSALDPLVRNDLQFELLQIQAKMGKTIVFITHDINEAFRLGTRVGILRDGRMIQIATPVEMLTNPADDYVTNFVTNADSSRVLTIRNIMTRPNCMVRINDGAEIALHTMRINGVSSAYVVDDHMRFRGIVTLDAAFKCMNDGAIFEDVLISNIPIIENPDSFVEKAKHIAAASTFPLPVVDTDGCFCGIVTKAAVLASL